MVKERFPQGLRVTIKAMTVEGERVAVEAESLGTRTGRKDLPQSVSPSVAGKICLLYTRLDRVTWVERIHLESGRPAEAPKIRYVTASTQSPASHER